jgi:hypothetical protein
MSPPQPRASVLQAKNDAADPACLCPDRVCGHFPSQRLSKNRSVAPFLPSPGRAALRRETLNQIAGEFIDRLGRADVPELNERAEIAEGTGDRLERGGTSSELWTEALLACSARLLCCPMNAPRPDGCQIAFVIGM